MFLIILTMCCVCSCIIGCCYNQKLKLGKAAANAEKRGTITTRYVVFNEEGLRVTAHAPATASFADDDCFQAFVDAEM